MSDRLWTKTTGIVGGCITLLSLLHCTAPAHAQSRAMIATEVYLQVTRPCVAAGLRLSGQPAQPEDVIEFITRMRLQYGTRSEDGFVDAAMQLIQENASLRRHENRMAMIYPLFLDTCIRSVMDELQ